MQLQKIKRDNELFEEWFEDILRPDLSKNTVIAMDKTSFHRKMKLQELASQCGCSFIFLPPYSPELNPTRYLWAWLKGTLRKILTKLLPFNDILFDGFYIAFYENGI